MTDWLTDLDAILRAAFAGDSWTLSAALAAPVAWPLGLLVTLLGGGATAVLYRRVPPLERWLEPVIMVGSYLAIGAIIFFAVVERFFLDSQISWSTTIPAFLFLIMTWFGCSYNVKLRTHLAFEEVRGRLPRPLQMACLLLDGCLWIVFSWVVIVTSTKVAVNSAANFQIMLGTDDVMQWWFLISLPLAFLTLTARAMLVVADDWQAYRTGAPLIRAAVIGEAQA